MRLLLVTMLMMGSTVLMMEFALVDTVRIHQQATEPVGVTFRDRNGKTWDAELVPNVLPRTDAARQRDENRARILWEASRHVRDLRGRHRILKELVSIQSTYRPRGLKALEITSRALAKAPQAPVAPKKD